MISFRGFLLLLLSREFFIFQIADVHLLHSATWWRLLGQKYLLTEEVTAPIKGRKVGRLGGNEIEPRYLGCYNLGLSFSERWWGLHSKSPRRLHEIENRLLTHGHVVDDHARLTNQIAHGHGERGVESRLPQSAVRGRWECGALGQTRPTFVVPAPFRVFISSPPLS